MIIQIFENALPHDLCLSINEYISSAPLKDVNYEVQKGVIGCEIRNGLLIDIEPLGLEIANKYFSRFEHAKYDLELEVVEVLRYPNGTYCDTHVDNELITEKDVEKGVLRLLSMILFLNDDYEGGEIYFKDQDVLVTPKYRSMVVFPCSFMVPHGVSKVHGTRDVLGINFSTSSDNLLGY